MPLWRLSRSSPQRAAIRAITLGSVRWYLRLAPAVEMLLTKPKGLADPLHALLVASAHQVEYSRNAPQATVHAAVDAARMLKEERATGLGERGLAPICERTRRSFRPRR